MPLFGSSKKSPQELVKNLTENLKWLQSEGDNDSKKLSQVKESTTKTLQGIKNVLCGTADQEPSSELVAQLAQEMYSNNTFQDMVLNLSHFDFEDRKEVVVIFSVLLRRQIGVRSPTVEFISSREEILRKLLKGYENPEIALTSGMMLRECIRYEALAREVLINDHSFFNLFQYIKASAFDTSTDAFSTFKELLTQNKTLTAEFLEKNYDEFFSEYRELLDSKNYAVCREALKLLAELLLCRHNFVYMTRYISNDDNLKLMMNLLRDKSRNIQFEAFHVFKIFVANPNKARPVLEILLKNKEKLVEFLTNFHTDRTDDEQFNDEKTYLIKQIKELEPTEENVS